MDFCEIGVFFGLKEMSSKGFAAEAQTIFMKRCDPRMLKNSELFCSGIQRHSHGSGSAAMTQGQNLVAELLRRGGPEE